MMIWRYQRHQRDVWFPVRAKSEEAAMERALSDGATKLTILSTSEIITDDCSEERINSLRYKGPLYFDLDLAKELRTAIESAQTLFAKLVAMGVERADIRIYLSGSKGLHLMVPQESFCSTNSFKSLPLIYKEMARDLFVPGLDYQVYSAKKGNCWRIVNQKRDDGRYRVPISADELAVLDEEGYKALVKSPRTGTFWNETPSGRQSAELGCLFEECRRKVGEKPRKIVVVSSENLEKISKETPACVNAICQAKGWKPEVNFNKAAMNLGAYIARTGVDRHREDALVSSLASNAHSSAYKTVRERLFHARGQVEYARHTEKQVFSCHAMRALLNTRPCDGCVLETSGTGSEEDGDMRALLRDDGYYALTPSGLARRLTNFLLDPMEVFNEIPQDGSISRRTGTRVRIMKAGVLVGSTTISEEAWNNRGNFIRELQGIAGLAFDGSDSDVQKIKQSFDHAAQEASELMQTYTCGVHIETVNDVEVATYVEPDGSINSLLIRDTHTFKGMLLSPPYLFKSERAQKGDPELDEAVYNMLSSTVPHYAGPIAGWFVAAHFKAHIMRHFRQFPILSLWGNAGSGKSKLSNLYSWVNGTDYHGEDSAINLPSAKEFGIREYCSTTTTVPRILDEFNKSKIKTPGLYESISELLKSAWEGTTTLRGVLTNRKADRGRTGAHVISIPITAPIVVLSEQEPEVIAVRDRSIRFHMSEKTKIGRSEFLEKATMGRHKLRELGKNLMIESLETKSSDVADQIRALEVLFPAAMRDRPRFSLQVVTFGMDTLLKILQELELPRAARKLQECREAFLHAVKITPISQQNSRSEVDEVMADIGMMILRSNRAIVESARETGGRSSDILLEENTEYLVEGPFLFIDPALIHLKYLRFARNITQRQPVIDRAEQFIKLLREETYFESEETLMSWNTQRQVFRLSIPKMGEKGLDLSLFVPATVPVGDM